MCSCEPVLSCKSLFYPASAYSMHWNYWMCGFLGFCGHVAGKAKMVEICQATFVGPFVWKANQCRHSLIHTVLTDKNFWPEIRKGWAARLISWTYGIMTCFSLLYLSWFLNSSRMCVRIHACDLILNKLNCYVCSHLCQSTAKICKEERTRGYFALLWFNILHVVLI